MCASILFYPMDGSMHFARQVSQHIALHKAGLGFLATPSIEGHRTFGNADRNSENGTTDAADSGITRNRRRNDD